MKNNLVVPGCLVGLLVIGLVGYGKAGEKVEVNAREIIETKETHKEDVKEINGSLKTLVGLVQQQAVMNGKLQTTMDFIQKDIQEIKAK